MDHLNGHSVRWEAFSALSSIESRRHAVITALDGGRVMDGLFSENSTVLPVIHSSNSIIKLCALLKIGDKRSEVFSVFPLPKGDPVKINIETVLPWKNGLEGDVEGYLPDGSNISFFAPFFLKEFADALPDDEIEVNLSGIATSIRDDTGTSFEINKGSFYEEMLKRFLKANRKMTEQYFIPPIVHIDGSMVLVSGRHYGVFDYRSPIFQLEETNFFGVRVVMVKISITPSNDSDDESVMITLYIPEAVLGEYKPKLGDNIAGTMLLTGYVHDI
jgi:hypothetical protein